MANLTLTKKPQLTLTPKAKPNSTTPTASEASPVVEKPKFTLPVPMWKAVRSAMDENNNERSVAKPIMAIKKDTEISFMPEVKMANAGTNRQAGKINAVMGSVVSGKKETASMPTPTEPQSGITMPGAKSAGSSYSSYDLDNQISELQRQNSLSAESMYGNIDMQKINQIRETGREIARLEVLRDKKREEEKSIPYEVKRARWEELAALQRPLTDAEKIEAKAAIKELQGSILDRITIPFSEDKDKKAAHTDNIALAGVLDQRTNGATATAAGVLEGIPFVGNLTEKALDMEQEVLRGSNYPSAKYYPDNYNIMRYAPVENPGAYRIGQVGSNVGQLMGLNAIFKAGVGTAKFLPGIVTKLLPNALSVGTKDALDKASDGGTPTEVAKAGGIGFFKGFGGGIAAEVVGPVAGSIINSTSVPAAILRDGISGIAYTAGSMGTNMLLDPEYRPTGEEAAKDMAVSFAFSMLTSMLNTLGKTQTDKARMQQYADDIKREYATIVNSSDGKVTMDALDSLAAKNAQVRADLANNSYLGQQKTVNGILDFLDELDGSIAAAQASNYNSGITSGTSSSGTAAQTMLPSGGTISALGDGAVKTPSVPWVSTTHAGADHGIEQLPKLKEQNNGVSMMPGANVDNKPATTGEAAQVNPGVRTKIGDVVGDIPPSENAAPYRALPDEGVRGADGTLIAEKKIPSTNGVKGMDARKAELLPIRKVELLPVWGTQGGTTADPSGKIGAPNFVPLPILDGRLGARSTPALPVWGTQGGTTADPSGKIGAPSFVPLPIFDSPLRARGIPDLPMWGAQGGRMAGPSGETGAPSFVPLPIFDSRLGARSTPALPVWGAQDGKTVDNPGENGIIVGKDTEGAGESVKSKLIPPTEEIREILDNEGLTQDKIDYIVSLPKSQKPKPEAYLSGKYIEEHKQSFKNFGLVKIMPIEPTGTIGGKGGTFVMSGYQLNDIIKSSNGDISKIEDALGFDRGYLGKNPVIVEIHNYSGLRLPQGNELGALPEYWLPGGYTIGGIKEAVIDPAQIGTYTYRHLF